MSEDDEFKELIDKFKSQFGDRSLFMLGTRSVREVAFSDELPNQRKILQLVAIQVECCDWIRTLTNEPDLFSGANNNGNAKQGN